MATEMPSATGRRTASSSGVVSSQQLPAGWFNALLGAAGGTTFRPAPIAVASLRQRAGISLPDLYKQTSVDPSIEAEADAIVSNWAKTIMGTGATASSGLAAQQAAARAAIAKRIANARKQISKAGAGLQVAIPQTAATVSPTFVAPPTMGNVYENYLQSSGISAQDVANIRAQNQAQIQGLADLAARSAAQQQAAQQQYYDNMRLYAQQMTAQALQDFARRQAG